MKGEPGRPAGAGWAGGSGGRGGGRAGGGVGAPASAHVLPGAGRRSPARAFRANAAAPPEPGPGIRLPPIGSKRARAGAPSSAPSGSCQLPGSAWHLAGLTKETLRAVAALLEGRGGSGKLGGSRGARGRSPRPAPRTAPAYVGKALRPGRAARARTRCHPWGPVSAPGLAPSRPGGPAVPSGRPRGKCGRSAPRLAAATSESARAGARRAASAGLPARAKAHPSAAARSRSRSRSPPRLDTLGCGFAGSGGG